MPEAGCMQPLICPPHSLAAIRVTTPGTSAPLAHSRASSRALLCVTHLHPLQSAVTACVVTRHTLNFALSPGSTPRHSAPTWTRQGPNTPDSPDRCQECQPTLPDTTSPPSSTATTLPSCQGVSSMSSKARHPDTPTPRHFPTAPTGLRPFPFLADLLDG